MRRMNLVTLACGALLAGALASPALATVVNITTNVAASTSWGPTGSGAALTGDVFWVQNSIAVNGGITLTVYPGTIIKFTQYTGLTVNGSLQIQGTAGNNVYITSIRDDTHGGDTNGDGGTTSPASSDWDGITFNSMSPDTSRLVFTDVSYAGYSQRGALQFSNGIAGDVTDCTLTRCYSGVECFGTAFPAIVGSTIQTSTFTPLEMDVQSTPVLSNLTCSTGDNGYDAFALHSTSLATTATLPKRAATFGVNAISNVTYLMISTITINSPGSLTINPGVVIKPLGGGIQVNSGANLTMNGTSTDTISVTSINDDNLGLPRDTNNNGSITSPHAGDWDRIVFAAGATGSAQYARLKFGQSGISNGLIEMTNLSIGVSNTLLSDAGHGLVLHGTSAPALNNLQINNMSSTPILMSVTATPTFGTIALQSNKITALGIIGEQINANAHLTQRTIAGFSNITYYLMNGFLEMLNPAVLTIDPNVIVKFQAYGSGITIDGGLIANGTASNPIVFTSERDDNWGNPQDTNGDGSSTSPNTGDWYYIHFTNSAITAQCQMTHCRMLYNGYDPSYGYAPSIWVTSSAPTIANCMINKSNYGYKIDGNATPTIGAADTVQNCAYSPIAMSVQSDPNFSSTNIYQSNGINGIMLISETLSQNSRLKYRPQVTFPPPSTTVFAYLVNGGGITVPTGTTLSIDPQVVVKVYNGGTGFTVNGTINAVGGAGTNQIVFTSYADDAYGGDTNNDGSASSPAVGNWTCMFQMNATSVNNLLRDCLFQFGGSGPTNGVVNTQGASPTIAQCNFTLDRTAMVFDGNSTPLVDSVSVLDFTSIPISMSLVANPTFLNMTIQGTPANSYTVLGLLGETYAQNVHTRVRVLGSGILNNIAYAPTGTIDIAFGAAWTIDPGVVIKLGRSGDPIGQTIQIEGALVANGKPDSLIVFTSSADDAFGGDTYGDGASTTPRLNDWNYIYFTSTSNPAQTVMNNVRVRYGGTPAIRMTNIGPTFSNMMVTGCGEGIRVEGNSAPTFSTVDVDSSSIPIRMSLVSNPTFSNVLFQQDNITGLAVINETIAQDLLWKIRSLSQRANMPYYIDGTLGVGLSSTLTLQPGLIVKLKNATIDVNKGMIAVGRAVPESLVVFTSSRDDFYGGRTDTTSVTTAPQAGDWYSIQMEATALTSNVHLHDAVFRYGGYSNYEGAVRAINSSFPIDSCLFAYNAVGVSVEGSANPTVTGSSLYGSTYYAIVNNGTSFCTNATGDWWGAANGPNDTNAAADVCGVGQTNLGSGDKVTNNVNYAGWATTGLLNPLLGDVSLNGQVTAYDASLVLQKVVLLISLNPLQTTIADVDDNGAIQNTDATFILQLVAGLIHALPADHSALEKLPPSLQAGVLSARRAMDGDFQVQLGTPRRSGSEWLLPVEVTGTGQVFGAELELAGGAAGDLASVDVAGNALMAYNPAGGTDRIALASPAALPQGELVTLHFPADGDKPFDAPTLTMARVNYETLQFGAPPVPVPHLSYLAPPRPNPARGPMTISFGLAAADAGTHARVEVLDLAGRRIRTLMDGPLTPGVHDLTWDLSDASGEVVHPGVYLVRALAGDFHSVRRFVLVR